MATVVSELARNALSYAGGGRVHFDVETSAAPPLLVVEVGDRGPGIRNLEQILGGGYESRTGMGVGLAGSRRLMDTFHVHSAPGTGTTVRVGKRLPGTLNALDLERAASNLGRTPPGDPVSALQAQNQELLETLAALAEREERLRFVNQELEDTNRGVVALYAELEEKAERLREANQLKTTFLSYMSHELRTPLHSILGLARILLARLDGDLTPEQHKQLELMQGAAGDLLGMVNDLLDLAKVEAGKTDVHVTTFAVGSMFGALRALFAPLVTNPDVRLVFEEPRDVPLLTTDEGKVSQILRNFIANALKFTARGEVRVSATADPAGGTVRFSVQDTGIGIPPADQSRLFQDFAQVGGAGRAAAGGTGLGLSIARKFAELLGGRVGVQSGPNAGSLFYADIPLVFPDTPEVHTPEPDDPGEVPTPAARPAVLVIDDNEADRYLLTTLLSREHFEVHAAPGGREGLAHALERPYHAALLDLNMPDLPGTAVLRELRAHTATRGVPVLIVTSQVLDPAERAELEDLGASLHAKARLYAGDTAELMTALWRAVRHAELPHE